MKLKVAVLCTALAAVCCGTSAKAANYPPGPGACALDSTQMTIKYIQTSVAPCRPVHNDTVRAVRGRISALKTQGTSRSFYMQNNATPANHGYTGLDVFNGNPNFQANLSLGDSVIVYGRIDTTFGAKAGFPDANETEMVGMDFDNNTSIDFAIVSEGTLANVPPLHTTTTAEIRAPAITWTGVANASYTSGEPWENMLVRLKGPLVVGKRAYAGGGAELTYPGIETRSPIGGGMLVYLQSNPADSVVIDMTSFVTQTPPAVGTKIDSVYGVLQQRTRDGINQFRIAIRSSDDIFVALPPNVVEAFPVANDSVRVLFNADVTPATATDPNNYDLVTSGRGFDYVRMDGDNAVVGHLDGSFTIGALDSISVVGVTNAINGLTMTSPRGASFFNGLLSISTIQAPDPDSLGVCVDRSKFAGPGLTDGKKLSFTGVVTAFMLGREYYVQDQAGGPRSGIKVFAPATMIVGHKYLVATNITEFAGETECNRPTYLRDLGVAPTPPFYTGTLQQLDDFTCDPTQSVTNGEDYEGCLVDFSHNFKTSADAGIANPGGFFHATNIDTPADTTDIEIDADSAPGYDPQPDEYISVKGVLSYRFSQGVVFPRTDADLVKLGAVGVGSGSIRRVSFAAYPNPARQTKLQFALPQRADVDLSVYDLLGRKVATIVHGSLAPGSYTRSWDGLGDNGARRTSGVFFYRLKVGQEVINLRGVRIE
jgi:hypothetical protein